MSQVTLREVLPGGMGMSQVIQKFATNGKYSEQQKISVN